MSTGDIIGADIAIIEKFLEPIIGPIPNPITQGILSGMKLLAVAEPAVYNAVAAAIQGTPLTPEQEVAKNDAITRLQNPAGYFS